MDPSMYNLDVYNAPQHIPNHPLYKTRICRHWLRGHCRLTRCNFKHGWYDKAPVLLTRSTKASLEPPVIKTSIVWGKEAPLSKSIIVTKDDKFDKFDKIILPGVGSFPKAIKNLKKQNLFDSLKNFITNEKKPFLGICLGMQLLFEYSAEDGGSEGLNILSGTVKQLIPNGNLKVPNIGWREVEICKKNILLNGIDDKPIFYFVHKYACYSSEKKKYCC